MDKRPHIPRNVERQLWAESIGYCMNPECGRELITSEEGVSIAEIAHIHDHALGGGICFSNLILLCRTCHKEVDATRNDKTIPMLKEWKQKRNAAICAQFTQKFADFNELKICIVPLLKRNDSIYNSYGPKTTNNSLWKKFEPELICNNKKILLLLKHNKKFLHKRNQSIVDEFEEHVLEFEITRNENVNREKLFPKELMSIFGLQETSYFLATNVDPIQNLIQKIKAKHDIVITQSPIAINYTCGHDTKRISLLDGPNVLQELYTNWCHGKTPKTNLRTQDLIYFTNWLDVRGVPWVFVNVGDLTRILVHSLFEVQLVYEYQVSVDAINKIFLKEGLIIINMHNWNGAPFSAEAIEMIENSGAKAMSSNAFFSLCYRQILP